MANSIKFNDTTLDGWQDDVYFNGTALATNKRVYFNGTEVWRKHEFEPDSVIIDYSWFPDSSIASFYNTYTQSQWSNVFAVAPFFYQGSGGPDSRIEFTLNDDFRVTYYEKWNGDNGIDADGTGVGNTGGTFRIWQGRTVTGLESYTYSLSVTSSGNGNSKMRISYVPYE